MSKAKRKLSNFDFSGENAAVALVNKTQGGGANGYKTLVMKAADVVVELSMEEFLHRFFNMWYDDAEYLAKLMGYEVTSDSYEEMGYEWKHSLEDKVSLMKSVKDVSLLTVSPENLKEIANICKSIADKNGIQILDIEKYLTEDNTNGVSPVSELEAVVEDSNVETPSEVIKNMSTENVEVIEKSAVEALVAEAIEKATAAKEAEIAELQKSLNDFKEAQEAAKKAEYVEKAAAYEVLGVEDAEAFGVALMKMAEQEDLKVVSEVLEKALNIAKNIGEVSEEGHSVEVQDSAVSGVMKAIEARKAAKK